MRRLKNLDGLREVCPGFTELHLISDGNPNSEDAQDPKQKRDMRFAMRIGHSSVQEYVESERILQQTGATSYSVKEKHAHALMNSICLTVLSDLQTLVLAPEDIQARHPLAIRRTILAGTLSKKQQSRAYRSVDHTTV